MVEKKIAPNALERAVFWVRKYKGGTNGVFLTVLSILSFFFTGQELTSVEVFRIQALAILGFLVSLASWIREDRLTLYLAQRLLQKDLHRLTVRASDGEEALAEYIREHFHEIWNDQKIFEAVNKLLSRGVETRVTKHT